MLAYNIDNLQDFDYPNNQNISGANNDLNELNAALTGISLSAGSTPDDYINDISDPNLKALARLIHQKEQVTRDRRMGFSWNLVPSSNTYTVSRITSAMGADTFQRYRGMAYHSSASTTATNNPTRVLTLDFNPTATNLPSASDLPGATSVATANRFLGAGGTNGALNNEIEEREFIRRARSGVKYIVQFSANTGLPGVVDFRSSIPYPNTVASPTTAFTSANPNIPPGINIKVLKLDFDPATNNYLGAAGANNTIDDETEEAEFIRRARIVNPQYVVRYVDDFTYGGIRYDKNPHDPYDASTRTTDLYVNNELETDIVSLGFDPTTNNYFGYGAPTNATEEARFIRLAISLGAQQRRLTSTANPPRFPPSGGVAQAKFPALFYLFPVVTHKHDGEATSPAPSTETVTQPTTEQYITDPYIFNTAVSDDVNSGYDYKILKDSGTNNNIEDRDTNGNVVALEDGVGAIAILPRITSRWSTFSATLPSTTAWALPNTDTTTNRVNTITDNGTSVGVAFLDKGIYNGRERMGVRVLDFDLDMLRNSTTFSGVGDQSWLPDSGIVYAFREDGVREDGIARPAATTTWTACNSASKILSNDCRMNAIGTTPVDPPLNPDTGISPKPVDFYADPDRRPFGFRLRNGADLRRIPDPPTDFQFRGMAFISDNSVYIQGDSNGIFNQHQAGGSRIEEFNTTLADDWNNFYTRTGINTNFATTNDAWRPAEIIADAITITSSNFVDGSIVEGIRGQFETGRGDSSYHNINAPGTTNRSWLREDGRNTNDVNDLIPVRISRNGFPLFNAPGTENTGFGGGRNTINAPNNNRINATIVSGLVASRPNQSYGGMHNFPRFIEDWGGQNLHISGAFIQLNFSTSATAPFDHDRWEPDGNDAAAAETIPYYGAPLRRWGYDVGLQYSPAGPVARRFAAPNNTRSEFYRELPIEDP
ncbi:MAG: hypothetical protein HC820_02390, partial [Hydrococcus sp. RM1_1_31]|nr:hypothetical protein [Hydrococcus sp. RM1_1_31]